MNIKLHEMRRVAKAAAKEILELYWPKGHCPVDPFEIARAMDISVERIRLEAAVAGGIWAKKGYSPIIFLNEKDHDNRQRFTCAHELGHYYSRQGQDEFESLDYRDTLASTGTNLAEVFANSFAANLLMPEEKVKQLKHEGLSIIRMANFFKVSSEAMFWRSENLGLE